jgi:transposase
MQSFPLFLTLQDRHVLVVGGTEAAARKAELLLSAGARVTLIADTVVGEIAQLIAIDPVWLQLDQAFRSIKGVADRTVARLLAELPEIGTLSNKAISKLAGLAPLARDSGKTQGKRPVRGGRSGVRAILFVVASVVRRYDADFAAFDQRLQAAGKPKKVIRIALAHKLLVRLNAKARQVRNPELAPCAVLVH